jgi:circadian clock protein KaiB
VTTAPETRWSLTLYVNGASARSVQAITVVRDICDQELEGRVDLTVLNAVDHPRRLAEDKILAIPTLVKHAPAPTRYLVGNLHDVTKVRRALDLGPLPPEPVPGQPAGGVG